MKNFFSFLFIVCCSIILFSSCEKDFSIENGESQIAAGSLWDSIGDCLPDTVIGTFYDGITPGSDTAYVNVQVNVTETGTYKIATDFQNGFEFSDSGFFTTKGLNTIRLKPIGTPTLLKPTTFNISFDSSFCSFTVDVQDSTGTGLSGGQDTTGQGGDPDGSLGNWQFTQGSFIFNGIVDSASKDNSTGLAVTYISINGSTSKGDTTLSLKFIIPASDIQPGTYTLVSNGIFFTVVDANTLTILDEADGLTPGTDFTVVVTSYESTSKTITGTFSGKVQDSSGNIVTVSNGSFTAIVSG